MSNKTAKAKNGKKEEQKTEEAEVIEALMNACAACSREERKVESTKFCMDCDENLCEKCVHDHKKFVVTKNHRITAKPKPPEEGPKPQLTDKCTHHEGKVLELYCTDHDELCCSVCVAVGHRVCRDVVYIPKAAVGIESSLELLEVKDAVKSVKTEVEKIRSMREENQRTVQHQKEDIIKMIVDLRARVSQILDDLERTAKKELNSRYDEMITKIDDDIKTCDDIGGTLGILATKLDTTEDNEAELFVHVKKAEKSVGEGRAVIRNINKNLGKERLSFTTDRSLENLLSGLDSLGKFDEEVHLFKAHFEGEYNISLSSDKGSSEDNTGATCLPDGKVLVTNVHHKRLKLLSNLYRVVDHCELPGKPYAVCLVSPTEAVTSLREEKILQFVDIEKKLRLSRTMRVGVPCYGVGSHNGELYVACVGGQYENRPQVRVYNISGRMLRVIEKGSNGVPIFSSPRNLIVNANGTLLHVTDREKGVITLGITGKVVHVVQSPELDSPRGITCDPDGNIFVCGQNSHSIVQLNPSGEEVGVVFKDRGGFHRPQSVCHVQRQHTAYLLTTFLKSKIVKVYVLS